MIEKNMFKQNDRLNQIDYFVDNFIENDNINELIDKYNLHKYKYIDDVRIFSLLKLRGSMKYINRYDKKLRNGGLLIKIYQKNNNWYGIIKKFDNTKYYISFNNNYIFYLEEKTKNQKIRETMEIFLNNVDNGKYDIK
jgi:hypothetical protein